MDILLGILDCTRESVSIARRLAGFARAMPLANLWLILNKTESDAMTAQMMDLLGELSARVIGAVPAITGLTHIALSGCPLDAHLASQSIEPIADRLEAIAAEAG